ncbi:MAG: hypothetical protein GKS00_21905 [Alphaproteobacteria bacterium]|nr:hypothetical protein [Alphaproteobacteria bacterium]
MAITAGAKIAIMAVSAAISAAGAISQGKAAKFEAAQLQQQADRDRQLAAQQANDLRDNEARQQARLRALVAGSGTTLEGTPLAVLGDITQEGEFQAQRTEASGATAANRAEGQAALRRFEGQNAQRAGTLRAGSTLLTSASQAFRG